MPKKTSSSARWLKEHFDDPFVKKAKQQGYRARAAYKLIELNQKDHIIKPAMTVVDLGSAPGSWSQVAAEWVGDKGQVIGLDILPMDAIAGVDFIEGDFREQSVLDQLEAMLKNQCIDAVISDMAPNLSGNKSIDQPRMMVLADLALDFALNHLKPGGSFTLKIFQGEGFDDYFKTLKQNFSQLRTRKPEASRDRSGEIYLVAKGYKK